jgi:hypothetical protein
MPYKNKEEKNANARANYEMNKEAKRAKNRAYYQANKEKESARKKKFHKINYQNNKEKLCKKGRVYYAKNKKVLVQKAITRQKSNPEKYSEINKRTIKKNYSKRMIRRAEYRSACKNYRLSEILGDKLRAAIRSNSNKSGKITELIGIPILDFKDYIQKLFKDGMTWENWGEWEIDHIKPCASFNLSNSVEQKECFHYTNFQPLWKRENQNKYSYHKGIKHSHKSKSVWQ